MEGSGNLEKSLKFCATFYYTPKEALSVFRNQPTDIENYVEYSRIYGFLLYLLYAIVLYELFPDYFGDFLNSINKSIISKGIFVY